MPLKTNAFDVLENFNVSRNHLEQKKKRINWIVRKKMNFIYRIFTNGVDSSASNRKLAKYGMTFSVKT
jgi:hypothetical protein